MSGASEKRYFLPSEVVLHNKPDDCWVSFLGKVYDVTDLVKTHQKNRIVKVMLAYAGKDISHWFDKRTKDIKKVVHPVSGLKVPYTPHGPLPDVDFPIPTSDWKPLKEEKEPVSGKPWWLDEFKELGYLSEKPRPIRVINVLMPASHRNNLVWVASEEKMRAIVKRIYPHNSHVGSYTFKYCGRILDNSKTLDQNGVPDERDKFMQLGLTDDNYIPAIKLYFNDDLSNY